MKGMLLIGSYLTQNKMLSCDLETHRTLENMKYILNFESGILPRGRCQIEGSLFGLGTVLTLLRLN